MAIVILKDNGLQLANCTQRASSVYQVRKQFFGFIISQDDVMDAMTIAMKKSGGLI